ncbi:hypothetical protein G3N92_12595 [Burkholderia sp. Ac-20379]|nr:hypothetical protein [Burkholderia sp. Ac-20379]
MTPPRAARPDHCVLTGNVPHIECMAYFQYRGINEAGTPALSHPRHQRHFVIENDYFESPAAPA